MKTYLCVRSDGFLSIALNNYCMSKKSCPILYGNYYIKWVLVLGHLVVRYKHGFYA